MRRLLVPLLCVAALAARAETPSLVLTQTGVLLEGADQPVTNPQQAMTFRVVDQNLPVAEQQVLWTGACEVPVAAGRYAVTLGAGCGAPIDAQIFASGADRWLEVSVGPVALAPRLRIGAVPAAAVAGRALDADRLGGKEPSAYAAAAHTHVAGEVTGLAAAAAAAVASAGVPWASVLEKPSTFPPATHAHAVADVTGLQAALDGRAPASHGHGIADVTGLQAALDGKLSAESDPKVGALVDGKWCSASGGRVTCTNEAPAASGAQATPGASAAAECAPATTGVLWFDSATSTLKLCNGSSYVAVSTVTAPPGPPATVSATSGNASLVVTWAAVPGATAYELAYQAGSTIDASATLVTVASGVTRTITGLTNNTTYAVAVRTIAGSWTSGWSATGTWIVGADGSASTRPAVTCRALLLAYPSKQSGPYWLDPDGGSPSNAFRTWCDMTFASGGWAVVAYQANGSADLTGAAAIGTPEQPGANSYKLETANIDALQAVSSQWGFIGRRSGKSVLMNTTGVFQGMASNTYAQLRYLLTGVGMSGCGSNAWTNPAFYPLDGSVPNPSCWAYPSSAYFYDFKSNASGTDGTGLTILLR